MPLPRARPRSRRPDLQPTTPERQGPADDDEVGDEEQRHTDGDGVDLEGQGRLQLASLAARHAGSAHRMFQGGLLRLQVVVVRRAGDQQPSADDRAERRDQHCRREVGLRAARHRTEPAVRQGEGNEDRDHEQWQHQRRPPPPAREWRLRPLDRANGTPQGDDPEATDVGHGHCEWEHGRPRLGRPSRWGAPPSVRGAEDGRHDDAPCIWSGRLAVPGNLARQGRTGADYGVISQPNIMAWSSWARLWQCAT